MRYVRGEDTALSVRCKFKNHSVTRIATLTFAGDKKIPEHVDGHAVDIYICGKRCLNTQGDDLLNSVSLAVAYEKIPARIEYHRFRVRDRCERVFSEDDVICRREF